MSASVWDGTSELAVVRRTSQCNKRFYAAVWAGPGQTLTEAVELAIQEWKQTLPDSRFEVVPMIQDQAARIYGMCNAYS